MKRLGGGYSVGSILAMSVGEVDQLLIAELKSSKREEEAAKKNK